mmetsp:Transcript_32763/g.113417  ORF Transcript_32763/g.113417 Transcript_32763/m.113417 type:complete len:206 (-) Transcript_32763:1101-1718(-)
MLPWKGRMSVPRRALHLVFGGALALAAAVLLASPWASAWRPVSRRHRAGALNCEARRPHVVVFVADDLGGADVGYGWVPGGPRRIPTPRVDALAAGSVVLDRFYVSPMCTPTRASLFTGKHAFRLGLAHFVIVANQPTGLPDGEVTLAQRLRARGYATHALGKWHLGFAKSEWLPTRRGFDSFFGYVTGAQVPHADPARMHKAVA